MMKLHALSFLLVRILSLYMIVQGLQHLVNSVQLLVPFVFESPRLVNAVTMFLFVSVTGICLIIFGLFVWIKTAWIVNRIHREQEWSDVETGEVKVSKLYVLGLTLVGVYLMVETFPAWLSLIGQLLYSTSEYPAALETQRSMTWLQLGISTLKLILAIVLVLRASGVMGTIHKIRGWGSSLP